MSPEPPPGFLVQPQPGGFAQGFGPVYLHEEGGRIGFRVAEAHLNPVGVCHGGALASFADLQIIGVRAALGPVVKHRPTVNLSIDYVAPAPLGADGAVVAQSRAIYHTPHG
jgi:uncharacterized protein (TIGR00369 family)